MLKITSANQAIEVKNIKMLLYGQPGVWKTSIAFTAESPLLLDFDQGSYRSEFRKDVVQITSWKDVVQMSAEDLSSYKTVCVDTVGRLLDVLTVNIITENPKMRGYGGALSLQGYGVLKSSYAIWLKTLISYGKDVVLIAHDKEEKDGDNMIVRADIQGGSYGEVLKQADGVGYMYRGAKGVTLDFSSSDRWVGKNVGGFEPFIVPNFHQQPEFLSGVIEKIKGSMNRLSADGQQISSAIDEWRTKIAEIESVDEINAAVKEVSKIKEKAILLQIKHLINNRATELGFEYVGIKGAGHYQEKKAA